MNDPKMKKKLLVGTLLLIVAVAGTLFMRTRAAGGSPDFFIDAWNAALGMFSGRELELASPEEAVSSTLSGQGSVGTDPGGASSWPSLLIEGNAPAIGRNVPAYEPPKMSAPPAAASSSDILPKAPPQWCDFDSGERRPDPEVGFNEVAWMGSAVSPGAEWIELGNFSDGAVALGDWQLSDREGRTQISFDATSTIARDGFLLVERDKDDLGALVNTGGHWKLFDAECRLVDELAAMNGWPAGNNRTKQTMERDRDGSGWHTSENAGGSPGERNSSPTASAPTGDEEESGEDAPDDESGSTSNEPPEETAPAPTTASTTTATSTASAPTSTFPSGHLLIATVRTTGGPGATAEDYIEIHNPTNTNADISGWRLRKRTQTGTESSIKVFPEGTVIAAGNGFTWANSANGFADSIGAGASSTQTISDNNSVALLDAEGLLVDAVAWGSEHADPFIEGSAFPDNMEAGQLLRRKLSEAGMQDTDNNSVDFSITP